MDYIIKFNEIDRLLFDIKNKHCLITLLVEEKQDLKRDDEPWETFLIHFYNATTPIKKLNYFSIERPEPELPNEIDIDIKSIGYNFFVGKYNLLLGLVEQLQETAKSICESLAPDHAFVTWTETIEDAWAPMYDWKEYIDAHDDQLSTS